MSIPDVPLKGAFQLDACLVVGCHDGLSNRPSFSTRATDTADIDIEVVGGRVIHIKGEKTKDSSHVSFDKRFSIGQHLNESNLKAKLTKDGDLVVTAPKVGTGKKDEVRKIPIQEEL